MQSYIFDIEIKKGLFQVLFVKTQTNQKIIDAYCKAHYNCNMEVLPELRKAIDHRLFTITRHNTNDYLLLVDFLKYHREYIGYNSNNYDNILLDYIIYTISKYNKFGINKEGHIVDHLYNLSSNIITDNFGYSERREVLKYYRRPYRGIDLQKVLYLDKPKFISLKQCAVQLKWYWIQDLPFDPYSEYSEDEFNDIVLYLWNDVFITHALYWNQRSEIKLRDDISKIYNINLRNYSRSDIANRLVSDFYCEKSNLDYKDIKDLRTYRNEIRWGKVISNKIKFESKEFKTFLKNLKNTRYLIYKDKEKETDTQTVNYPVFFRDNIYTVATGGLHTVDKPKQFISTDEYDYIDIDVSSFYPRIIINERVAPKQLNKEIFLKIVEEITDERLNAKKLASILSKTKNLTSELEVKLKESKTKADALKIVINAVYGKLGDQYSFLYDPKAMYTVTINGQLYLLMLAEQMELGGFKVISANTDGIICKVSKNKTVKFNKIMKDWENYTGFELEQSKYEKYIRHAVNDYIAVKEGYKDAPENEKDNYLKEKGLFTTSIKIDKGYNKPVIAKALRAFFVDDIKVTDFIKNHDNIYDFCMSVKTSRDFKNEYHYIENNKKKVKVLQKDLRYYISNSGGSLLKAYESPKPNKKGVIVTHIALSAGTYNTPFLMFKPVKNFKEYDINYNYYLSETYKIIYAILYGKNKGKRVTQVGTLFD